MNEEQLVETPSLVPEQLPMATTFAVDPAAKPEEGPVKPEDVKPGELLKVISAQPTGPVTPLPSTIATMLERQKIEQARAQKHYYDLAAKHVKDVIFIAAKMKMKPLALRAIQQSAFALMEQQKDLPVVAVSMGLPDPITQFSLWKFHFTFPTFDKDKKEYNSVDSKGESTVVVLNQYVMEGLTPEFAGLVCFRDGSIAIGDPKHFFTQLILTKMASDAQKMKRKKAQRVH